MPTFSEKNCYIAGMADISSPYDKVVSLAKARRAVTAVFREWLDTIEVCAPAVPMPERVALERERMDLLRIQNAILKRFLEISVWRPRRGDKSNGD